MADEAQQEKGHWTVDKRIPIALIFTLVFQTAVGFIWVGGIDRTVAEHEKSIEDFRANGTPGVREKLSRLEERTNGQDRAIARIESGIERLNLKLDQALESRRK